METPALTTSHDDLLRLCALSVDELRRRAKLRFRLAPNGASLLRDLADSMLTEVRERNSRGEPTRLILPIGPVSHYARLVEISNTEKISWKNVHLFGMDEFLDWQGRPIPPDHPLSFEGYLRREVFERIDPALLQPPKEQILFPHPFRIDEASERIRAVGGIDCCFGGIGFHGHVAFNEPPLSRWSRVTLQELRESLTRVVTLGSDSIVVQSIHSSGGCAGAIPPMAVTLGMKDILASRRIRLYCAAGERHRAVFRFSVAGEPTVEFPSTLVQGHPNAEVVTDAATAQPITIGLR